MDVQGHAVLLSTGGDLEFGLPEYGVDASYLTASGARWLRERRPTLVGIDAVNIDDLADPVRPAHTEVLGAGIYVLEHLTNLAALPRTGARLHAAPPAFAPDRHLAGAGVRRRGHGMSTLIADVIAWLGGSALQAAYARTSAGRLKAQRAGSQVLNPLAPPACSPTESTTATGRPRALWSRRELVEGHEVRSPSVQAVIAPDGSVTVLGTHEQRLGGANGQVFEGATFPADLLYAGQLGRHARAVGRELAKRGAVGRFAVDFVAARPSSLTGWRLYGLEVNLRKGGTTHTLGLRGPLRKGRYDARITHWNPATGWARKYQLRIVGVIVTRTPAS